MDVRPLELCTGGMEITESFCKNSLSKKVLLRPRQRRGLGPGAVPRPVVVRTVHLRVCVDVPHPLRTGETAQKDIDGVRRL